MLDHISNVTVRHCLEALVQLYREDNEEAAWAFCRALDIATTDRITGERMLILVARAGKMPLRKDN